MGRIEMSVDASGVEGIMRRLDTIDNIPERATAALTAGAEIVLAEAVRRAPVRTGKLKRALRLGSRSGYGRRQAVEVGVFKGEAPHAHLVEHGHGGPKPAPAHAFLEPAFEDVREQAIEAIMAELMKE